MRSIYDPHQVTFILMGKFKFFIALCFFTLAVACTKEEPELQVLWNQASAEIIQKGVTVSYEEQNLSLRFHLGSNYDVSVSSNSPWITPQITTLSNEYDLTCRIEGNNDISDRAGTIILTSHGKSTTINIHQDGYPKVIPSKEVYYCDANENDVEVTVTAKGNLSASLYPQNIDWAKVTRILNRGSNIFSVFVHVNKNVDLGRITCLVFSLNGKKGISPDVPIMQSPSKLPNVLTVRTNKPGCLQILLGGDIENLRRIKHLTLEGGINGLDYPVLKKLLLDKPNSISDNPIELDLSGAIFVGGNSNPYEYYGWKPANIDKDDVYVYGELPSYLFKDAYNLKSIKLPNSLKSIGMSTFSGCKNLQQIDIPNSVERVSSKAFWDCNNLKRIVITNSSNLNFIGNQAFTTNSWLDELNIPITAINIATGGFLGCKVKKLHLNWPDYPIELNIVPETQGAVLYVPKGSKEIYQKTKNWLKFNEIIEE